MTDASDRAREVLEGETLEQYADRIVAATRKAMMDRLDDDVIGCLGKSHLIFGKACAIEAVTTAMREMQAGMDAARASRPDPIATAHAAGRAEGMEEAARWHDECEALIASAQARAELVGALDLTIGDMETRRRDHRNFAAAIRARITTPAGGESHG
jgi:hypothetical protein